MKRILTMAAMLLPAIAWGQDLPSSTPAAAIDESTPAVLPDLARESATGSGFLTGNRNFSRFIGFMSNPSQSIEGRAVTQAWPVFGDVRISTSPLIPQGAMQSYGAGLNLALSERLSIGLSQGGFASTQFQRDPSYLFRDVAINLPEIDRREALKFLREKFPKDPRAAIEYVRELKQRSAELKQKIEALEAKLSQIPDSQARQGWLNLGGFAQYMVYQNVEGQAFATVGLRWEAPCGSQDMFQGRGPAYLAPYLTVGKEFGNWHVLAITGYEFAAERRESSSEFLYCNVHIDRQTFGWLYPLLEINTTHYTTRYDVAIPTERGYFDFGSFTTSGNLVTMAVGANAVLIRNKLELGAIYNCPLYSERSLSFDGLLVKAVYRY
ncbi:MAG: hypothetical protein U0744_18580 [Gemmataceae bacterium]